MSRRREKLVVAEATHDPATTGGEGGGWRRRGTRLYAIFGAGALLSAAMVLQAVGNFGFHIAATRILGPAEYTRLGVLLNLTLFVGVPLVAVQLAATMAVARARERAGGGELGMGPLRRRLWVIAGSVGGLLLVAAPAIDSFFRVEHMPSTLLVALFIGVSVLVAGWRGAAIGRGRDRQTAVSIVASPLVRVGLGVPLLLAGGGVVVAMVATVAGEVVSAIVLASAVRGRSREGRAGVVMNLSSAGSGSVMLAGLWLFSGVDVFVAARLLDAEVAGEYLAIAALARTALMIPQMLAAVGVRQWAPEGGGGVAADKRMSVGATLALWGVLGAGGGTLFWASAEWWVSVLFGVVQVSPEASEVATLMLVGSILFGLTTITGFYLEARGSKLARAGWVGALAVLAASVGGGPLEGGVDLAGRRLVVIAVGAALASLYVWREGGKRQRVGREDGSVRGSGEPAVLHVVGEYILEEGMGRTIDEIAGRCRQESGGRVVSDVLCARSSSRGGGLRNVIAIGGNTSWFMARRRLLERVGTGYDLVHFHGGVFALLAGAAVARKRPVVVTVYGVGGWPRLSEWRRVGWRSMWASNAVSLRALVGALIPTWVVVRAVRRVDAVLTHDPRWREEMVGRGVEVREGRPGGRAVSARAVWSEERPEVIFVGRSEMVRGVGILCAAYEKIRQRHPGVRLSLYLLRTSEAEKIEALTEGREGISVSFEALSAPEERLAGAQVGVWAYLAEYTTSPPALAPVEALSVGLPVVGTSVACLQSVLDGGSVGAVVGVGEVEELAEAIGALISNRDRWEAASEAALAHSRSFGWEQYGREVFGLYEESWQRARTGRVGV